MALEIALEYTCSNGHGLDIFLLPNLKDIYEAVLQPGNNILGAVTML
jgi:hypothetical protein